MVMHICIGNENNREYSRFSKDGHQMGSFNLEKHEKKRFYSQNLEAIWLFIRWVSSKSLCNAGIECENSVVELCVIMADMTLPADLAPTGS